MINLIKYEIRKQFISKIIIVSSIVIIDIVFLIGILMAKKDIITITNGLLQVISILGILYIAFEPAAVFENDLGKKQGYLLFMTPNSSLKITGAKVLAGAIQLSIVFSLVVGMFTVNDLLLSGYLGNEVHQLDEIFNAFGDIGFSFWEFILTGIMLLFVWFDFITLTFLVTSISYAYIAKGKLNTFFSIVLFVILFIAETIFISGPTALSFSSNSTAEVAFITLSILIFAIPTVINGFFTIVLLDKKVSL